MHPLYVALYAVYGMILCSCYRFAAEFILRSTAIQRATRTFAASHLTPVVAVFHNLYRKKDNSEQGTNRLLSLDLEHYFKIIKSKIRPSLPRKSLDVTALYIFGVSIHPFNFSYLLPTRFTLHQLNWVILFIRSKLQTIAIWISRAFMKFGRFWNEFWPLAKTSSL